MFNETFISYFYWNCESKYLWNVLQSPNCEIKYPENVIFSNCKIKYPQNLIPYANYLSSCQKSEKTRAILKEKFWTDRQ